MSIEIPKDYAAILKDEADWIIKKYADRLEKATSTLDETQKIMEEEEMTDPELKELLPLKVMATIREKGKYKTFKELRDKKDLSKYAKEAGRDSYFIEKREREK